MNLETALGVGLFPSSNSIIQDSSNSYDIADNDSDGPPDVLLPVWGQWLNSRDALSVVDDRLEIEELVRASNAAEQFLYYTEYLPGRGHKDELWENKLEEEYVDYTPIIDKYEPWLIEDKNNIWYGDSQENKAEETPLDSITSSPIQLENNEQAIEQETTDTSQSTYLDSFFIAEAINALRKSISLAQIPERIRSLSPYCGL